MVSTHGEAMDIVFMDFRKTFDTIPRKIFTEKLLKYGQDEVDQKLSGPRGQWAVVQCLVEGQL